jgi:hypothetical protein
MSEPWKSEPLTMTAEQRTAALRAISSARSSVRPLAMAETDSLVHSKAGAIDQRLLSLQRFFEGKRTSVTRE